MKLVLAFLVAAGGAVFLWSQLSGQPVLSIGPAKVRVAIADTPAERQQGLSGRKNLGPNEGLLFIFDKPGFYPFWMKEMNFPIDIIWLDGDWRVIDIDQYVPPQSFPRLFQSREPVQYVLEVNAGFAQKNKIGFGQRAILK